MSVKMFVDDGTIYTGKMQSHIDQAPWYLKQLMIHVITIKLAKWTWETDEANLIGHVVTCGQGVSADIDKISDLLAITSLPTIGDLKAFLGSCVYINRFIKDYAMITAPIYALKAKYKTKTSPIVATGAYRNWSDKHERALKTLQAALATSPCLAFPDFSRPFIICADCSKCQMGGCLVQLSAEGKERIIAFTSKRLPGAQVKYGVTKNVERMKADDVVGESLLVAEVPPHLQSPAEGAMPGDPCAYDEGKLEKHMQMLIHGASVDMEDIAMCESVIKKVQQITEDSTAVPALWSQTSKGSPPMEHCVQCPRGTLDGRRSPYAKVQIRACMDAYHDRRVQQMGYRQASEQHSASGNGTPQHGRVGGGRGPYRA